jgi:hypothetical protein
MGASAFSLDLQMPTPTRIAEPGTRYAPTSDARPERELKGHIDRSGTTVHGWSAVGFGLLALTPAVYLGLVLMGVVGDLAAANAPLWVIGACALAFGVAGLSLTVHGARGVMTRRAAAVQRRGFPLQPWQWDYDWDVRGTTDRGWEEARRAFMFAVMASLILAPGNWAMIALPDMPVWAKGVVVLLDLMIAYALWRGAYVALRTIKYGRPRLHAQRFPLHPGGLAELVLERRGRLGSMSTLDVTLRCVQERYEKRGSGENRSQAVVCYELWADTRRVECTPSAPLELQFDIPARLPGCALNERPPRYWELEVTGEAPGIDYGGCFLVPIYATV